VTIDWAVVLYDLTIAVGTVLCVAWVLWCDSKVLR
jgi:hypothetical protein